MKDEIKSRRMVKNTNKDLTITGLRKINVVFGKNGTGKSSFLKNVYRDDNDDQFHLVVSERGGDIGHDSGYLDQENNPAQRKAARNNDNDAGYRNRAMSRAANILSHIGHKAFTEGTAGNLRADDITSLFRVFLPEFNIVFGNVAPFSLQVYRDVDGQMMRVSSANELSSGQKEAITLAADIITQAVLWDSSKKTLLIDEPDAHLHTDLANRFAIFINEIADKFDMQVIIATHSSGLISSLLNLDSDVGIICFDESSEVISTIKSGDVAIFGNLLSIELSLAVVLGRKIIIVEGNDDFLVWNQAARSQSFKDIALIQAGGGDILKYKNNAEKILRAVHDNPKKFGITILDGDGKGPCAKNKKDILPCERLGCHSLENLLLTNEVLSMMKEGIDLNKELKNLKKQKNITKEEKIEIDRLVKDKQNTKISKPLARKIHAYIDPYASSRDWRILVGSKLGVEKPTGELSEFLGNDIVSYIWE